MSSFDDMIRRNQDARRARGFLTDMERVIGLPVVEHAEGGSKWTDTLRHDPAGPALRPIQERALTEIARGGGLFGAIGVGHGKTLIGLFAGTVLQAKRPLLLCPPPLVDQMLTDADEWRKWYTFTPPAVVSYGILSTAKGTHLIEDYKPDLIIADEAHSLRRPTSARTKRVARYLRQNPGTAFVALSGTMTSKSLFDFAHLLEWATRENCPIPGSYRSREQWAAVLDTEGEADRDAWIGFWPLVRWAFGALRLPDDEESRKTTARRAFQKRLDKTAGVVLTTSGSCDASLYLAPAFVNIPDGVRRCLAHLQNTWSLPDGTPLADGTAYARAARQLSAGFYYVWEWPGGLADLEWLDARSAWSRAVSHVLRYQSRAGLDSPLLVSQWVEAGNGSAELRTAWAAWSSVKHRPAPPTRAVWVDPFLVDFAESWQASQASPPLIWYASKAMHDALKSRKIPTYGEGDTPPPPGTVAAVSVAVFSKGHNFQAWQNQIILEPPSSGAIFEQLIGRTHRQGQTAGSVWVHIMQHARPFRKAVNKAQIEAQYIEATTGQRQKLNFARWVSNTSRGGLSPNDKQQ